MTLQTHINGLREAIWRGERQIDRLYAERAGDIGAICAMEEWSPWFDEIRRQQRVRREQLERLLKKQNASK